MRLQLTGNYRNCSYINDFNQVVYDVKTECNLFSSVTTIKRAIDNDNRTGRSSGGDRSAPSRHQLTNIARIEFNSFSPTIIRFDGGIEHEMVFRKIGWSNALGFMGGDGLEYKWRLVDDVPQLVRRDTTKTLIACCGLKNGGFFSSRRVISLEIFPDGIHMIEFIIITCICALKEFIQSERLNE